MTLKNLSYTTYDEAKKLCEEIDKKSSIDSLILRKYVDKYGHDEVLKGVPPLYVRQSKNYKAHELESKKSFKALQDTNKWFMKNFSKEYAKERSEPNYRMIRQKEIRAQREEVEAIVSQIEVSI